MNLPDLTLLHTEAELLALRASLPKCKAGDELQGYKWALAGRLRLVRLKAGGKYSHQDARKLIVAAGNKCPECEHEMLPWITGRYPTVDHIVPVSKGGSNDISNLRVICNRCNAKRGNRCQTES